MITPKDVSGYKLVVNMCQPVFGNFDYGPKDKFEFTAEVETTPGSPAVRWGSWEANCWFVLPCEQKSIAKHIAVARGRLSRGKPERQITVIKPERLSC
jgi:hypothetical protein